MLSRDGCNQALCVVVARSVEHLIGRAILDHAALVHHGDLMADLRRDTKVVGDEDNAKATLIKVHH